MLKFIYSTVNAGKSANLIMRMHSCTERDIKYICFVPSIAGSRDGTATIRSRIGFTTEAHSFSSKEDLFQITISKLVEEKEKLQSIKVIFVDEAQFLTKSQVRNLCSINDELEIPIHAYGLRTDFKGEPFEGSKYLMAWADVIEEIPTFEAGTAQKATFNLKVDSDGARVNDGDSISPSFNYIPVSRKSFNSN